MATTIPMEAVELALQQNDTRRIINGREVTESMPYMVRMTNVNDGLL